MTHAMRHIAAITIAWAAAGAHALCTPEWLAGDAVPGANGSVLALTMWDPDGPGPQPARLVVGGSFGVAGTVIANNIAEWDPATGSWSTLGSGMSSSSAFVPSWVTSLTTLPNAEGGSDLIAGGAFTFAGGVPASGIARWDGTSWSPLGSGLPETVYALTTIPNAQGGVDLIAGGRFNVAGGVPANRIARWDGAAWSPLGDGLTGSVPIVAVRALATLPNPLGGIDLIAGGNFTFAGGIPASRIARWDGSAWSPMGSGVSGKLSDITTVYALATLRNDQGGVDLAVGGNFTSAGGVPAGMVARWSGNAWSPWTPFNIGMAGHVFALTPVPNGQGGVDLVAGGHFKTIAGGVVVNQIARWNGISWMPMGAGIGGYNVSALAAVPNAQSGFDVIAGGSFSSAGGTPATCIARWDDTDWSPLLSGTNDIVLALATLPNDRGGTDLIAGGAFLTAGGVPANRIARWDGNAWNPLGSGMEGGFSPSVNALATLPSPQGGADLIAGGRFQTAGGEPVNHIARWDGSSWHSLGGGVNLSFGPSVSALMTIPNAMGGTDLIAGGGFTQAGGAPAKYIARWDGSSWSPIGNGLWAPVYSLATLPNAQGGLDLIAGGSSVLRWDGTAWSPVGSGLGGNQYALTTLPNAQGGLDLIAGGKISYGVLRWDGSTWSTLGGGLTGNGVSMPWVLALATLPNAQGGTDLIAGGAFNVAGGAPASRIARWDGQQWSPIDGGMGHGSYDKILAVHGLITTPNAQGGADLIAGGAFTAAGTKVSAHVARWGCPPPPCYPDCDGNSALNIDDFLCFQLQFALNDPYADCDRNSLFNIDDFLCFQLAFALGC